MKRKCLAIAIILLLVVTFIIPANAQDIEKPLPASRSNWLYVGGSGPGNYSSIQAAIDNASAGDFIYIYTGTYYESLNLRKSLTLQGQDANLTIIDGRQANYTLCVNVTEFHLKNLGFRSTGRHEIEIETANDSSITDCQFIGNLTAETFSGLRIDKASHLHILRCTFINYWDGIDAINTVDSIIEHCRFSNQQRSVSINLGCNNCRVDNCTIIGQPQSISGNRGMDVYSPGNLIINCNINNCTEGICLYSNSNYSNVINCTISNCSWRGIFCAESHDHLIKRCTLSGCGFDTYFHDYAIETWDSGNIIDACIIKDNPGGGVEFQWPGGQNTLCRSTLIHNGYGGEVSEGFFCTSHLPNYVYFNNFVNNQIQAWDYYHTCTCDNGTLGNYWSDYKGRDWNHDLIGTQPYHLYNNSNTDNSPLLCPYNPDGPSVLLQRPNHAEHTYVYFFGLRFIRFPYTLLLGSTLIKAVAVDYTHTARITKVVFSVDGIPRHTDRLPPYTWTWILSKKLDHTHTLTVTAYDSLGHTGSDTLVVKKFF